MERLANGFTVLQVTPELDTGGVEQTTVDIAAAIVAAGGRALVASAGGRMEPLLKAAGGELLRLPVQSKNPLVMVAIARALAAAIRREGVGIVHARSRAPAFAAGWAARRAGVPFITTYHGVYNARSPLKRWYNGVMARSDLVIANSAFTRDHLIAQHGTDPGKVLTVPRGVDLQRFDPTAVSDSRVQAFRTGLGLQASDRRPVLLLAGRVTRWKGQAFMIEVLAKLRERGGPEAVLVLAGDAQGRNDYVRELQGKAKTAGLEDAVRFAGHATDMPAAYLACDLALAPSLDPEAFGRTAVEPQAMGRLVLASDHGAVRETVVEGETGWRVTPGDGEAWATALHHALTLDLSRRRAMEATARSRARSLYSVEAMREATLRAYAELGARR